MKMSIPSKSSARLTLQAETASDLMKPNPLSIKHTATAREAIAFLTKRGFSAAPVIDESGRPIGVLSRSDLLIHSNQANQATGSSSTPQGDMLVGELMTPAVFSVTPEASAQRVVEEMVGCNVHRLFVVDASGVLVGVISPLDVLERLRP